MNDKMKSKIIHLTMKKCLNDNIDYISVFAEVLDKNREEGEKLVNSLKKIADDKNQKERFLELLARVDNIKKWSLFLLHEQTRQGSIWKDDLIKEFATKITDWFKKDITTNYIDGTLTTAINVLQSELISRQDLEKYIQLWRILLLRKVFREVMEGY